ncbi:MAG: PEP-CTERM sorting domain-containing protein [Desulfobacterium sp.]
MKRHLLTCTIAPMLFFVFFFSSNAFAYDYGFDSITNNSDINANNGEAQLSFSVTQLSNTQLEFVFKNAGPEDANITSIHFKDDVSLMTWVDFSAQTSAGVSFVMDTRSANLKGINFPVDYSFFRTRQGGVSNGINQGEVLGLIFDFTEGDWDEIIAALDTDSLSVGMHVQAFGDGGSEKFISTSSTNPVPEPASMVLLGIGLMGIAGVSRKKVLKK